MRNYVKAIVTAVFMMAAVAVMPVVADAAVTAPTNLKQIGATTSSVEFKWDAVLDADDYYVSWSLDGITWSEPKCAWGVDESIYNLSAGRSYFVRVQSFDEGPTYGTLDDVYSDWSAPLEVVTAPDAAEMKPLTATSIMSNAVSLSWSPATGATSYTVSMSYPMEISLGTTAVTSFTASNLTANTVYRLVVTPVRTSPSGYSASSNYLYDYYTTADIVTAPGTASGSNFGVYSNSSSTSGQASATFFATDPAGKASGYEVEVYKVKGGKLAKKFESTTNISPTVSFKKNTPYKYRVRFFTTSNGQKLYGGYSGFRYFCMQKISGKRVYSLRTSYCKIKMKWSKVAGASGYTVYVSKNAKSGFKKVKSLGKKATGVTFTKMGKKKLSKFTKYYVKVVAKVKDGKKVISNDTQAIQETR